MPLSEEEQRILREIETQFHVEDPKLAREVSRTSVYRHTWRHLKLAVLGVIVSMVAMVVFLAMQLVVLSVLAFAGAVVCGVWSYYAFGHMTRAGMNDLRRRSHVARDWGAIRDRLRRDEEL